MAANVKQLFRLWGIYAKMDLVWFLRDTKYCVYNIIADTVSSLSAIVGVFLLAERFGNIGGMTRDQILFMLGYACIIEGVELMFFLMNNVGFISRPIGRGQLDHKLVQPVPIWMQHATEGFIPFSGNTMLLFGLGLTAYAAKQLGLSTGPAWMLLFIFSVICSMTIIVSFSYIASCVAFYAPAAGEEISTTAMGLFGSLKSFPLGGLTATASTVLCTAIPVGLAAWFPASVLLGQSPSLPNALLPIMAIILALTASTLFKKGMKHYAKSGSIRYSARGHRR